jgi:putative ABC transport system substrate-binding protein
VIGVVSRRKPGVTHEKFVKSTSPLNQAGQMFGLISYGPQLEEIYRRIPVHVDKILKGAKPDVPTELPTKFEFLINLKTAKQIGLTIPPNVLARADKVIKDAPG